MTTSSRGSYPHPVLDNWDDVASYFEVSNVAVSPAYEDVGLSFDLRTDDPTLRELIASGQARYSLRWHCSATLATEEITPTVRAPIANGYQFEVWIDQRQIRGEVTVDVRVLASQALQNFQWERQHSDYGGATFALSAGDVLADGGSFTFEADKLYDPLNPPIGSCFKFVEDDKVRRGLVVTFDDDEVVIVRMSPEVSRNLGLLSAQPELQICAVVLPALMEAIAFIQRTREDVSDEDITDRVWFKAIGDVVERYGGFDERPLDLAQQILDHPIDRTLALAADLGEEDE